MGVSGMTGTRWKIGGIWGLWKEALQWENGSAMSG